MEGNAKCFTPCEPGSPRRCFESGSSSEKYTTGHVCIGDQVHLGKYKLTGRQRVTIGLLSILPTFIPIVNSPGHCRPIEDKYIVDSSENGKELKRCRKLIWKRKNVSCVKKGTANIVSNCSDNNVEKIQVPTARSEHASNDRDAKVDKIHVPTVECDHVAHCSDASDNKIQVPTARNEHASNSSDTNVDKIQVPTVECDRVPHFSDTSDDGQKLPTAGSSAATVDHTEAPMAQCDTATNFDTCLEKQNSSPPPNRRVIRVNLHKPVELHHATQAWKARKDCSTNDLTRKAKAILNKLSPENYAKLTSQLKSLNIDDEKDATNLANLLFQKAVEDQTYAYLYAQVCRDLMWSFYVILETSNLEDFQRVVNFRFIVAKKAQDEFENLLHRLSGEPSSSQRRYNRGILNFLAELVNQGVLTEKVAEQEIMKTLVQHWTSNESDQYTIECLCTFLNAAGKAFDSPNKQRREAESKLIFNLCFELLQVLAEPKGLLNSRLRFMIMDLIQLKRNLWMKKK